MYDNSWVTAKGLLAGEKIVIEYKEDVYISTIFLAIWDFFYVITPSCHSYV